MYILTKTVIYNFKKISLVIIDLYNTIEFVKFFKNQLIMLRINFKKIGAIFIVNLNSNNRTSKQ